MARVEGQMWIDSASPNKLKYYVNKMEYEVEVTPSFQVPSDSGIHIGQMACIRGGKLYPARFPTDMTNVVGVMGTTFVTKGDNGDVNYAHIIRNGILILDEEDINAVFDTNEVPNGMDTSSLIGAPVYWFIGRWTKNGDSFTYTDPREKVGKLTLYTPSGFQWKQTTAEDSSFNVGYDYLPTVGSVKKVTLVGNTIKGMTIDVNFTGIEESFGWTWPYYHFENGSMVDMVEPTDGKAEIIIRHGLFPREDASTKDLNIVPSCVCQTSIIDIKKMQYNANVSIDNYKTEYDTKLEMLTPDTYKYLVHGSIAYKLDKGHN